MKLAKLMKCINGDTYITVVEPSEGKSKTLFTCQRAIFITGECYHRKVKRVYPSRYYFSQRESEDCLVIVLERED